MYPDYKTFLSLTDSGNLIPVYREVLADMETPVSAYLKLFTSPSFLFESVEGGEQWGRYSFLGISARKIIRARGNNVEVIQDGKSVKKSVYADPLDALKEELSIYKPVVVEGLPAFYGGLVGYTGYEMVRFFERVPDRDKPSLGLSDMYFIMPDIVLIFDNLKQSLKIVCPVHVEGSPDMAYREAEKKIEATIERLKTVPRVSEGSGKRSSGEKVVSSFGPEEVFKEAVRKAKAYVWAGDVVQVVISQRFERECAVDPFNIYRALRVINPSPYMYFMDTGEARIVPLPRYW